MNLLLCIERSTRETRCALFHDQIPIAQFSEQKNRESPGKWPWRIRQLFLDTKTEIAGLGGIVVGIGPGSYAGIRSSLATAQGLAAPDHLPVLGFGSAFIMARGLSRTHPGRPIAVVGDARRGYLWILNISPGSLSGNTAGDFLLSAPSDLSAQIPPNALTATSEWERIGDLLKEKLPGRDVLEQNRFPDAVTLGSTALAIPQYALRNPRPIYLHPPTVQSPASRQEASFCQFSPSYGANPRSIKYL